MTTMTNLDAFANRPAFLVYNPTTQLVECRVALLNGSADHIVATFQATSPPPDTDE